MTQFQLTRWNLLCLQHSKIVWQSFFLILGILLMGLQGQQAMAQGVPAYNKANPKSNMAELHILKDEVELQGLVDLVSKRLGIKIFYDDTIKNKKLTLRAPGEIPTESLLEVLQLALKMKGFAMVDDGVPGWKRIVSISTDKFTAIAPEGKAAKVIGQQGAVTPIMQIFVLEHATPDEAAKFVKPFLSSKGGDSIPLQNSRVLIVTDYASNLIKIGNLIKLMDTPRPHVVTRFVRIQHIEAAELAQQLKSLISAKQKAQGVRGDGGVEVAFDERTNQLTLVGTKDKVDELMKLAKSFDVPLGVSTQLYTLKYVAPERIDELIQNLIDPIQAKRLYRSAIDAEGNALIATTTPEIHRQIGSLINRMDLPSTQRQSPIRFYKLKNTTVDTVLETLRAIQDANTGQTSSGTQRSASYAPNLPPNDRVDGAMHMPLEPGQSPPPLQLVDRPQNRHPSSQSSSTTTPSISMAFSGAQVTADANTNTLIVVADPSVQRMFEELIRSLDQRRPQVLIEAKIVAIDTSDDFELGVEISGGDRLGEKLKFAFSSFGLNEVTSAGLMTLNPAIGFNGALINSNVADTIVKAVAQHARAKVLSAPRILVNDNTPGELRSIKSVPYQSVNASQTVSTTSLGGNQDAGTTITVTPHINEGDHLQLEFSIEFSSFLGEGTATLPPSRHVDNINSTVTIPDGNTVIVGGLNLRDRAKSVTGLPILENVPLVKYATSHRQIGETCTSFFVFIRPTILRDDKFKDLKFLSERSTRAACEPGEYPISQPILMR